MGTETDDQRGRPHASAAPVFPWFPPHHPHTNKQYPLPITPYLPSLTTALPWRETPTTCKLLHLIGRYPLLERRFLAWKVFFLFIERCFPCLLVFFLFGKVFPWLERFFLVWKGFSCLERFFLFGKVFPCLERFFLVWKGFSLVEGVPSRNPQTSLETTTQPPNLPRNHHENPRPPATLFHVERWFSLGYRGLCSWLPYILA